MSVTHTITFNTYILAYRGLLYKCVCSNVSIEHGIFSFGSGIVCRLLAQTSVLKKLKKSGHMVLNCEPVPIIILNFNLLDLRRDCVTNLVSPEV